MMKAIAQSVRKPSRYSGCEVRRGTIPWEEARVRFLLAFPDVYEIGMSHLGIVLLREILNARPATLCERVFAPWPDMEAHLRGEGLPLSSLESGRPARDFDAVGFSLCYELTLTNVLAMLDLAGIPLRARDRGDGDPLVLAGGVGTLNPAPVAPFFDALLVGDGEEAILEIAALIEDRGRTGGGRQALLGALSRIEGVYVPGLSAAAKRRILPDLARSPLLSEPILPAMRIVHDRLSVEIARGCTRGCRFCQAGYVYRPVRERDPLLLLRYLQETAPRTGFDEVGLLSLSAADYGCIDRLITEAMRTLSPERISVSLPSVRLDALRENTVRQIRKVRKTGFTLAPEAGTERLRRSVNKEMADDDLLRAAEIIFSNGWHSLKLYFMLGLPGETAGDVRAVGELARRVAAVARRHSRRAVVTVSLSTFIPKPHTPFQWERQIGPEESLERVSMVRSAVGRDRNVDVKFHAPAMSELEGVISRGDGRLPDVILAAFRLGARFDAWTESFRPETWRRAFAEAGVDPKEYLRERAPGEKLPWDVVDAGIDGEFLAAEREKARRGETTPDCRHGACSACGSCPPGVAPITYAGDAAGPAPPEREDPAEAAAPPEARFTVRIRYAKEGPARHLSGLEIQSLWGRILRRSGLRPAYSRGFNPAPRLSFSPALPVGTESLAEFVEADFHYPVPAADVARLLPPCLPEGLSLADVTVVPPGSRRLSDHDLSCVYRILPVAPHRLPEDVTPERAARALADLRAGLIPPARVEREGETSEIDLSPLVADFRANGDGLSVTIIQGTGRGIRPLDAASTLLGTPLSPELFAPKKVAAELIPRRTT